MDSSSRDHTQATCVALDLISVAESLGEHFDMEDGPCNVDGLCTSWICQASGCIKDKADRARALISSAERVPGESSRDDLKAAEAQVEAMRKALEPFAKIAPSSFYADDGSEAERYTVRLYDGTRHEPPHDFTGADLARARAALSASQEKSSYDPANSGWRDIASAPKDRPIEVYAPGAKYDLNDLVTLCQWHEDAGFCVCELREPTHWRPHNPPAAPEGER